MKIITTTFLLFIAAMAIGQTSLQGTLRDADSQEPMVFATVLLYQGDKLVANGETDFDGKFKVDKLEPGKYSVQFSSMGYSNLQIAELDIPAGNNNHLKASMRSGQVSGCLSIVYEVPVYRLDNFSTGSNFSAKDIRRAPIRN